MSHPEIHSELISALAQIKGMLDYDRRTYLVEESLEEQIDQVGVTRHSEMDIDLTRIVRHFDYVGKLDVLIKTAKEMRPKNPEIANRLNVILSRLSDEQQRNENDYPQDSSTETTMLGKFKYNIFISHASEDRPIIEQLIQEFRRAGVTYWIDHEQIGFGDQIAEKIEEGLRESKYVLVCLSANLARSNWVRAEYGSILSLELGRDSQDSGKKVILLKIDNSSDDNIPLLLHNKKRANYSNLTEFDQLLEFLKQRPKFPVSYSEEAVALFDVFLAHNSQDKPLVESIAEKLKQRGLNPWLDKEQIPPGRWFQDVIQQAITTVKSAAIFIGPKGLGKGQRIELRTFISQCVEADLPVIPVLLPGVSDIPEDLPFLTELNWVRFSSSIDDSEALDNLEWGITGKHPRKS